MRYYLRIGTPPDSNQDSSPEYGQAPANLSGHIVISDRFWENSAAGLDGDQLPIWLQFALDLGLVVQDGAQQ